MNGERKALDEVGTISSPVFMGGLNMIPNKSLRLFF